MLEGICVLHTYPRGGTADVLSATSRGMIGTQKIDDADVLSATADFMVASRTRGEASVNVTTFADSSLSPLSLLVTPDVTVVTTSVASNPNPSQL